MSITTLGQLIQVLTLQKNNLATYQTQVGATAGDITAVTNEMNNLNAVSAYADVVDANKQTVFQIKQAMFNGNPDEVLAAFPAFPAAPTLTAAVAGSLKRTNDRNARFKSAPGYNGDIGVALGIAGAGPLPPDPASQKPAIDVFAAQTGYLFSVVVRNRAQSDMWQVMTQPVGGSGWTVAGSATGKSTDITYSPSSTEAGNPVQLQVRIQLMSNNTNYGQPSDISLATVNP